MLFKVPMKASRFLWYLLGASCFLWAMNLQAAVPFPNLDIGQGGHCVDDPQYMRLNHMKLLLKQRDESVRQGIRGGKYSLARCVNCHASKVNHSVLGTNRNFCQGCHVYASVKIDCFECHSSSPTAHTLERQVAAQSQKE